MLLFEGTYVPCGQAVKQFPSEFVNFPFGQVDNRPVEVTAALEDLPAGPVAPVLPMKGISIVNRKWK